MSKMSRAALVALLLIGGSPVLIAAPAEAKKKEEAPKGPVLTPEFRKAALPAQTALDAKDFATAEPLVVAAEAAAKTDDELHYTRIFRLRLESGKLEQRAGGSSAIFQAGEGALIGPMEALINDPKSEQKLVANLAFKRGVIAFDQKQYAVAITFLTKARDLGETAPDLQLELVKAYILSSDITTAAAEMKKSIAAEKAAGRLPPEDWYDYIIPRLSAAGKTAEFLSWSADKLKDYPSPKNLRSLVGYYGLFGKNAEKFDKQQKIDMFRLLRAGKALADEADYGQFAQYLQDIGLPFEAKAVLDEGKAANKMPMTRDDDKALYAAASAAIKSYGSNSAHDAEARASKDGVSANTSANVYLGEGNYAKAIEFYQLALSKCGTATGPAATKCAARTDEITTRLGIAYALSGDVANARDTFGKVTGEQRKQIAQFWVGWLDMKPAA